MREQEVVSSNGESAFVVYDRERAFAYRIQADGIIYAEENQEENLASYQTPRMHSRDVIGSSCYQSAACDVGRGYAGLRHLLQVDYRPELRDHHDSDYMSDSWSIVYTPPNKRSNSDSEYNAVNVAIIDGDSGFPVKEPGKHYRDQLCMFEWSWYFLDESDSTCIALVTNAGSDTSDISSVSMDGGVFARTIDCSQKVPMAYRRMCSWAVDPTLSSLTGEWTPLNGNCKKKGIPGIISSATVGGVLLIAGICYWMKRRHRQATNQTPTTPPAPTVDRYDATTFFPSYPTAVAIPVERKQASSNPAQQVLVENNQNPHTEVGMESALHDAEDFA